METVDQKLNALDNLLQQITNPFNRSRVENYILEYGNKRVPYQLTLEVFIGRVRQYAPFHIFVEIMELLDIDWKGYDLSNFPIGAPEERMNET